MQKHIPNLLSFSRVIFTPIFLYFLLFSEYTHAKLISVIIFSIASITDAFDGKIARKYGLETRLGIFLDPLADKFLVLSAFFSFVFLGDVHFWMVILISFRDIIITILRMIMEAKGITMITSKVGKLKTVLQIIIINIVLFYILLKSYGFTYYSEIFVKYNIIYIMMLITTLVTIYTGFHYFYYNHKKLKTLLFQK
ncbi:MAG: CDP-diacylglycerol--glycerol-3-phosphate 3-phosphatidyltransferase [Candidatus Marinimicrobia bacterium]|nr:CDP-diacylglycerol--glycerol-3-phosphate 3-phosphatidyltransferase [Candidatus Neomarinimicrobiota bacterium]|tara:strand:- start:2562 stop:3149 length:588 start_codon:yes stop_codon:yes gene_type:complete